VGGFDVERTLKMDYDFAYRARIAAGNGEGAIAGLELLAGLWNMTEPLYHKAANRSILVRFRKVQPEPLVEIGDSGVS
jgi:hypothetical protein